MSKPWEDPLTPWKTKGEFINWVRGQIRGSLWSNHPVKNEYLKQQRFKAPLGIKSEKNPKGKMVYCVGCKICNKTVKLSKPRGQRYSNYNVDHLIGGEGFSDLDENFLEWVKRLCLITSKDIRILCVECHKIVNISQRRGITFEEAAVVKKVLTLKKQTIEDQKEILLKYYKESEISNNKKREQCFIDLINKGFIK